MYLLLFYENNIMCVIVGFFSVERQVIYQISKDLVGLVIIVLEKKRFESDKISKSLIHETCSRKAGTHQDL